MITIQGEHPFSFACVDCGLFSTDGQWIYPERVGDCYELIYALSGKIFIREGDEEYELQKGDILILRPGFKREGTQGSFGRTSFYWAQFRTLLRILTSSSGRPTPLSRRPTPPTPCCSSS